MKVNTGGAGQWGQRVVIGFEKGNEGKYRKGWSMGPEGLS